MTVVTPRAVSTSGPGLPGSARARPLLVGGVPAVPALTVLACVAGVLAAMAPLLCLVVFAALGLAAVVAVRPAAAAYLVLALTPVLAGMDRGEILPLLRPNEALLFFVGAVVAARAGFLWLCGSHGELHVRPLDLWLVPLVLTSSLAPVLWLVARGSESGTEDLQHALTMPKYLLLYLLIRYTVTTERQVARCLWLILASSAAVALVAILQALQLFGVPTLLAAYYSPFGNEAALANQRGTSTLASSIAVGDVMAYSTAVALGWLMRGGRPRSLLLVTTIVLTFGALASGQFSGIIALGVSVLAVGGVTGQLRRVAYAAVPAVALGSLVLRPVIDRRLSGFSSREGLPQSWVVRWENLQTFFWPELFSDGNFLLGVRPSARVPAPEPWREFVWIESGHTWLLWTGGLPLLLAFLAFLVAALRIVGRAARRSEGAIGAAAVGAFAALAVLAVLMTLDAHLTLRGSADLLFPLLALATTGSVNRLASRARGAGRTPEA